MKAPPFKKGCPVQAELLNPPFAFSQRCYVRDMMATVPRIQTHTLRQTHHSNLRMSKSSFEIRRLERLQHQHPTLMQRLKQSKRNFNRRRARFLELGPAIFMVRPYGWFI